MYINQANVAQPSFQTSPLKSISSSSSSSPKEFEVISFESLLTASDKRTILAVEDYADNNGTSRKELHRLENAIAAEKLFAQREGKAIPSIDKKMMTEIYNGAKAGRMNLDGKFLEMIISNFNELKGVNIVS